MGGKEVASQKNVRLMKLKKLTPNTALMIRAATLAVTCPSWWSLYSSLSMFGHLGKLAEELLGDDAVYIGEIFKHFKLFVSHLQSSWKCSKKRNFDFALSTCIPWLSASSRKLSRLTRPSFEALSYRSKRSKSRVHILKFPTFITRSFACLGFSFFPWQR